VGYWRQDGALFMGAYFDHHKKSFNFQCYSIASKKVLHGSFINGNIDLYIILPDCKKVRLKANQSNVNSKSHLFFEIIFKPRLLKLFWLARKDSLVQEYIYELVETQVLCNKATEEIRLIERVG